MKKERLTKLMSAMTAIVITASFVMSSLINVHAAETNTSVITLKSGKDINTALKALAGDTLPADSSVSSLYLVIDTKITGFERVDAVDTAAETRNLSEDGSAVAWLNGTTVQWYAGASTVYLNSDSSYMFYGLSALQSVNGLRTVDTTRVENTSYMFAEDADMASLDLSDISTIKVTNMKSMFAGMSSLSSLNISNMNTVNTTDMSEMFRRDASLTVLDLSSFTVTKNAVTTAAADSSTTAATSAPAASPEASSQATAVPSASSSTVSVSTETNITDMFKESALSKVYVGYTWLAELSKDPVMVRVFTTWFNQTLVMASDTELKDISFTYSLTPGASMNSSDTSDEVLPGIVTENCSIANASFHNTDTALKGTPADPSFEGKKYMTKKVKILIDTTQITEPGIYRYVITETTPLEGVDAGLFQLDESSTRILDILAEYQTEDSISVTASVFHKTQTQLLGKTLDVNEKSSGFDNSYLLTTNDLVIRNEVSGNQGDSRHAYNYTFVLDGDIAGRELTVVHNDGSVETIKIDASNHGELNFSLRGTERITIKNIQKRSKYTITAEKEALKDTGVDVKATPSNSKAEYSPAVCYSPDTEKTCYITNLSVNEDVDVTFLNVKNGVVPTGIILDTAPYTLSFLMGVGGILLIQRKKKLQNCAEEED